MDFEKLISELETELKKPLPGKTGQVDMAPRPINNTRFNFRHLEDVKQSGVMILLYPENGSVYFPLMERNKYPGVHSGQISLPGGKMEPDDEHLMNTAKRETSEEMGVPQSSINFLGHLTEMYIEVSNFRVLPSVGYVSNTPKFEEDKREVVNLLKVDLSDLMNPENRNTTERRVRDDLELHIPYFNLYGYQVWGATAMILNEFLTIINRMKI